MPWLVVLGRGSWVYRAADGRLARYPSGVHEVDDAAADAARNAYSRGQTSLVVLDHEPALEEREPGRPLSMEDLKKGRAWGTVIREDGEPEPVQEEVGQYDYRCRICPPNEDGPVAFASRGRLKRHVDFHHADL